jgi:hypothetical protein
MKKEKMKEIIDAYIESYNSFDIDGMLFHMHEEVSFKNISAGQVTLSTHGIIELRSAAEEAKTFFKSRRQTVTSYQYRGDTATIEIDYMGEVASEIPNGPKAGDIINLKGKSEFVFKDGSIVKLTDIS